MDKGIALGVLDKVSKRYENFVLTTVCRTNTKLREELRLHFERNNYLKTDIMIDKAPEYQNVFVDEKDLNHFSKELRNEILADEFLSRPYIHQINAWKLILNGDDCVISTGTGSGKTESFLYPIIDYCLKNNHEKGVKAILIYPMKALASDQGKRIGKILDKLNEKYDLNLKFGIFDSDSGSKSKINTRERTGYDSEIYVKEEIVTGTPDILLTNYVMLERILLNRKYSDVLSKETLQFICLDELHYYSGAQGIDVSLLLRRLIFRLSDSKRIQFIGTSATLSSSIEKFSEINNFLLRIFNREFNHDQVIFPTYKKEDKPTVFKYPTKLSNLGDNVELLKAFKAHTFFRSPNSVFRCLECSIFFTKKEEKCSCESKSIYELHTCRQCGYEYYSYEFDYSKKTCDYGKLELDGNINPKLNHSQNIGTLLFSLKMLENSKLLYLNKISQTLSFTREKEDDLEIFISNMSNKINLIEDTNCHDCSNCGFVGRNVIAPVSRLSDENCSHIVFDEVFMNLNEERRKMLIFTDNVQRTSKFAREIQETHYKNIARTKLLVTLRKLNDPIKLSELVFNFEEEFSNLSEDVLNPLKIEFYEELMSNGKKVGSLANRNLFTISFNNINNLPEDKTALFNSLIPIFMKGGLLKKYKGLLDKDETSFKNFFDNKDLEKRVYKKINGLENKSIKGNNFPEARKILDYFKDQGILILEGDYFLLQNKYLLIENNSEITDEKNNYYDSWLIYDPIPPVKTEIDTGKTDADKRSRIEKEFKEKTNMVLVATSTMEMGIDIGDLDVVGLLYAPPSAAQYVQRVGRSGRNMNNCSLAITFLNNRSLDQTYFNNPEYLVKGEISPPKFNLALEIPNDKSLFALFLEYLIKYTDFSKHNYENCTFWSKEYELISKEFTEKIISFKVYVSDYSESMPLDLDIDNLLFSSWLPKIKDIELYYDKNNFDYLNLLKQARLLPDYAFGSGGAILKSYNAKPIIGFSLREICPPQTLDFNKTRFKCQKIELFKYKKLASVYKQHKRKAILFTENVEEIDEDFIFEDKEIIEPKVIYGKRSTFSLNQKRIYWNKYILNYYQNVFEGYYSDPFETTVVTLYPNEVSVKGKCEPAFITPEGKITNRYKAKRLDKSIGTFLKTRAIMLNTNFISADLGNTFLNAIIFATTIKAKCEDGEIDGFYIDSEQNNLVLYDNVEGGVGFVDIIKEEFNDLILEILELCQRSCCHDGCIRCIGSYRRQSDIGRMDKKSLLLEIKENFNINNI